MIQPTLLALRTNLFTDYASFFIVAQADPLLDKFAELAAAHDMSWLHRREAVFDVCCALTVQGVALADLAPAALIHHGHETRGVKRPCGQARGTRTGSSDHLPGMSCTAWGTSLTGHPRPCAPRCTAVKMPEGLAEELAKADRLGVKPVAPGTAEFDVVIDNVVVKWAVREDGSLVVVPKNIDGAGEISHSVLTRGAPVRAAGEASIGGNAQIGYFGLKITNHSGHFWPSLESLQIGLDAFAAAGVRF
ncbi:hypothetical protein ABZ816_31450 [Actinosynnema sp. NPDC047251]|uniref:Uncharacterized protein n=1 Tax=Saccharothrix espanaensis (strain ATCC 51144 / DSM 44229 / JCM 9112 / NBRC 15066 / NRRL 15764) TaxID=1179773 RepID=K0K7P8_SACES|nr:hypothetical protein [Saccharothrix espanaensis]CCH32909.1 hypothetical protein BN6_56500 [Saccharothrix espanaensis DSM 44229]